ncbi:MAG TPA: crotonase/enoyl-CoA hydratase family protein [Acidimicrobiia bacterium]|nr:crotonase/enoyl-CoA hydratase family protein [Acidimicrobiia bacterium]
MTVSYRREGSVAIITIDRPERRNAIDLAAAESLRSCWEQFDSDEGAQVGVLYGEGGHFSAGADLKAFDLVDHPDGYLGFTRTTAGKPTIAAIEGYCVAGGLEMALWCDLRVASEGAVFGCFERRFGVPLIDGGTQRLPLIIGRGRALDLILTGREVDANEAQAMGLINRIVPTGKALGASIALAASIAAHPQITLRSDRSALLRGVELQLDVERQLGLEALGQRGAEGIEWFRSGDGRGGRPVD